MLSVSRRLQISMMVLHRLMTVSYFGYHAVLSSIVQELCQNQILHGKKYHLSLKTIRMSTREWIDNTFSGHLFKVFKNVMIT